MEDKKSLSKDFEQYAKGRLSKEEFLTIKIEASVNVLSFVTRSIEKAVEQEDYNRVQVFIEKYMKELIELNNTITILQNL